MGADIVYLQETHLNNHAHKQLHKDWVGHMCFTLVLIPNQEQSWTALAQTHRSSICARHGLIQFKIIHCLHWLLHPLPPLGGVVLPVCKNQNQNSTKYFVR